jgi:hypothetical protein
VPPGGGEPLAWVELAAGVVLPPPPEPTPDAAGALGQAPAPEPVAAGEVVVAGVVVVEVGAAEVGVVEVGVVDVGVVEVAVVEVGLVDVGAAGPQVPWARFVVSLLTTVWPAVVAFGAWAVVCAAVADFALDLGTLVAEEALAGGVRFVNCASCLVAIARWWTSRGGMTTSGIPAPPDPTVGTVPWADDFRPDEPTSTAPAVTIAAAASPATAFVATAPIPAETTPVAPEAATAEPAAAVPDPAAAPELAAPAPPDPTE